MFIEFEDGFATLLWPFESGSFLSFFQRFWTKCHCKILYCNIVAVVQSAVFICTSAGSALRGRTGMFCADISMGLLIVLAFVLCCVFCAGISKCVLTVGPNPNRSHNLSRSRNLSMVGPVFFIQAPIRFLLPWFVGLPHFSCQCHPQTCQSRALCCLCQRWPGSAWG